MFDVVATHEHQATACVDSGRIEHSEARLPVLAAANEGRRRPVAHDPEHGHEAQKPDRNGAGGDNESATVVSDDRFHHRLNSLKPFEWQYLTAFFGLGQALRRHSL
ncbi:hypothetical protein [Ensifer sp. 1H6]|uniref:hypothetical protein n=1 Tax=Ensifer sp. 1H6 TaxID=1911585 RepID=UPI001FD91BC1|nr:hypothetical protein [Ensifer sp. 1H6]